MNYFKSSFFKIEREREEKLTCCKHFVCSDKVFIEMIL